MSGIIEVKLQHPEELSRDDWAECQVLLAETYLGTLLVPTESGERRLMTAKEARKMTGLENPVRFYESHIDPNREVGKSFYDDQDYRQMQVARTYVDGNFAGYGYTADNVSGKSEFGRNIKRLVPAKNYFWVRELVTSPEYHELGVATETIKAPLQAATSPKQIVTHYDWPEMQPAFINDKLQELGFRDTGQKPVDLFETGEKNVVMVRQEGPTVERLLARLSMHTPGQ